MCSQSVSGQSLINKVVIPLKDAPSSPHERTPVKGGAPMPPDQSLRGRINVMTGPLSGSKPLLNELRAVQEQRLQKPGGTPPPKTEGTSRQPMQVRDGGVPQTGSGPGSLKTGSGKVGSETMTPEAKHIATFKADYAHSMESLGKLPAPDGKTAHVLLANAANAKGLLVDFLFERRAQLGGEFAGLNKEQLADRLGQAPLARLSAADRMTVAELRSLRQTCLDRLNIMADTRDSAGLGEAASNRIKELDQYLKTAESILDAVITTWGGQTNELCLTLDSFLKQSLKGETPDRTVTAPVFEEMMKDLPKPLSWSELEKLPNDDPRRKQDRWVKQIRNTCDQALDVVFTGIANLAGERALLQRGISGPESTLRSFNISRSSAWWAENQGVFNYGMTLLNLCKETGRIPLPEEGKFFETLPHFVNLRGKFGDHMEDGKGLPPSGALDRELQALLQGLMPAKVDNSASKSALRAAVWKFDQALRFNARDRILVGLSPHPGQQIRQYVKSTPLFSWQKKTLAKRLMAVLDQHVLRVPPGGQKLTQGAQGAPRLVSLKPGEAPVLVKDMLPGQSSGPMLREMVMQEIGRDNPHIPRVIGIGVPQADAKGKAGGPPQLSLVMEAIPGKSLNSYLHTGFEEEDKKEDTLVTGLPPQDRGKVAAHLVAGGIRGLAPLHARGLAHMDVKPGNIMLDTNSLEGRLIDFGSACIPGAVTEKTPGYVPPDCFVASLASDVYALGVSLMQLAMGTLTDKHTGQWAKNLDHEYWKEHPEAKPLRDAARIMMDPVGARRPTLEQLLAILDGRPVPAREEGKDGASSEAIAILKKVFDPGGEWAGGRDVLAEGMRRTESGPVNQTVKVTLSEGTIASGTKK